MSTAVPMAGGTGDPLGVAVQGAADGDIAGRSPLALFLARFRRDRVAMGALVVIVLLVVVAIAAPLITAVAGTPPPGVQDFDAVDKEYGTPIGPSAGHPLGVYGNGVDLFTSIVYGARVSLGVGIVSTLLALLIGVTVGMVAGYYRGWVDGLLSRAIDVMLAFPILLLAIGIGAACTVDGCLDGAIQPGVGLVIFVIVISSWTYIARIIRGQVLSLREKEFVEASRSLGASDRRIMVRDILPNLVVPIIIYGTLLVPQSILFEAALSFFGIGVQQDSPTWGAMIADATRSLDSGWWYVAFPGTALLVTVLAFNLLGDGLQDALDPRRTT